MKSAEKKLYNVWFGCLDIVEGEGHGHDSGHSHLAQVEPVLHLQPAKRVPPNLRGNGYYSWTDPRMRNPRNYSILWKKKNITGHDAHKNSA